MRVSTTIIYYYIVEIDDFAAAANVEIICYFVVRMFRRAACGGGERTMRAFRISCVCTDRWTHLVFALLSARLHTNTRHTQTLHCGSFINIKHVIRTRNICVYAAYVVVIVAFLMCECLCVRDRLYIIWYTCISYMLFNKPIDYYIWLVVSAQNLCAPHRASSSCRPTHDGLCVSTQKHARCAIVINANQPHVCICVVLRLVVLCVVFVCVCVCC